jgi:hypothetical protein
MHGACLRVCCLPAMVWSDCVERLRGTIAWNDCVERLRGAIVWSAGRVAYSVQTPVFAADRFSPFLE